MHEPSSPPLTLEGVRPTLPDSVDACLRRSDPLDEAVVDFLLGYREEDGLVDFKLTFDFGDGAWLKVTKDVMAFSNSTGGYLVFGVRNGSFDLEGLPAEVGSALSDTDNIRKKLSRFVDPGFDHLRTKEFVRDGKRVAVWYLPENERHTHVVKKDASFKYPSGVKSTVLRQGTVWIRTSAGNRLADSRALNEILARRMSRERRRLLADITRVVEAPAESKVVVLGSGGETGADLRISDSPDAVEVKGLSFSVPPKSHEEEVAGWMAMSKRDSGTVPPVERLWTWYADRRGGRYSRDQRLALACWGLLSDVPAFYWLRDATAGEVKSVVLAAARHKACRSHMSNIIGTAAFVGVACHKATLKALSQFDGQISPRHKVVPCTSPKSLMRAAAVEGTVPSKRPAMSRRAMAEALDEIARQAKDLGRAPGALQQDKAIALDCLLYAQLNGYPRSRAETRH